MVIPNSILPIVIAFWSLYIQQQLIPVESFGTTHRPQSHLKRCSVVDQCPFTPLWTTKENRFKRKINVPSWSVSVSRYLQDTRTFGSVVDEEDNVEQFEEDDYDDDEFVLEDEPDDTILDWTWEPFNDIAQVYLPPPLTDSTLYPKTILHFIGGTVFGSYPRSFYASGFLQRIAQETHSIVVVTAIPISFQSNPLNHYQLAYTLAKAFRQVYQSILVDEYGVSNVKQMKIVGMGHSLGSRLHVILNTHPSLRKMALKRNANILLAFNNYNSMASIPGISTLNQGVQDTRKEYLEDQLQEEEEWNREGETLGNENRKVRNPRNKLDWEDDDDGGEEEEDEFERYFDGDDDDDDDDDLDEDISMEDIFSAMKKRVQRQLSSFKAQLTPTALLQDTSVLEFQPSPDELWQRIQQGVYVKNVAKTLIVQFDQDSLDQSSRLAKCVYDSWVQLNSTAVQNETLSNIQDWDLKFARLHGSHVTPIMVGSSNTLKTLVDRVTTSWTGIDRVLEESLKDYRNLLRQNQRAKQRTEQEQNDLVQSIIRYIIDIVQYGELK